MTLALAQANFAKDRNEVPVGAILVDCDSMEVIAEAHNESVSKNDPTAHAEIVALRKAAAIRQNYRLPRTAIYVTIEPCTMCVGAMYHSRVYNHRLDIHGGVLEDQCATVISNFFKGRRVDAEKEHVF